MLSAALVSTLTVAAQTQSPVAAYPLLGNANDISGNNYHGSLKAKTSSGIGTNVPVSVNGHEGAVNSAYTFSTPSNDCGYIDFGQPAKVSFDTLDFSISLWFKYSGTPFAPTFVTNVSSSYTSGFILGLTNNSGNIRPRFYLGPKGSSFQYGDIFADTILIPNNWYHFVAVADRAAKRMKVYIGGVQRKIIKNPNGCYGSVVGGNELNISGYQMSAAHSGSLFAGLTANFLSTAFTNGTLDNIYFFDRVLSPSEITGLANDVLPASIRKNQKDVVVNIFPNPASDEINIGIEERSQVIVSDLQGRVVITKEITPHANQVVLSDLVPGVYIITISNETSRAVQKIMKY
ncbi:MAG: Fibronectin type domain protein [Bacteroidetes bacterium]|nr:Fibronectin type domain protein [Bacteroidota bacterium]